MRRSLVVIALSCLAVTAAADAPPEGTLRLALLEGASAPIQVPAGANVVCDDLAIAHAELVGERLVIVAGHAGETLCGVRYGGLPRGLYLVTVRPKPAKKRAKRERALADD